MATVGEDNDMYKAILKEIGAEESYMEYLFEESDSEEVDDVEGDGNDLIGDFARTDTPRRGTPRGDAKAQQLSVQTLLREVASGDDDNMLTLWQSEGEDSGVDDPNKMKEEENVLSPETYITTSTDDSDSPFQEQVPTWKRMLEVANAKQEQIMNQMDSLQKAQRDSSPRNKMRVTVNLRKPSEDPEERSFASPLVLKEVNHNDSTLNSSMQSSSSTIHQISKRNATLQGQWQSQQEKSNKLQGKLAEMQTNFYKTQQQWEKEQQELFSPAKSPSKIPKWSSPTPNGSPAKTKGIPESPYVSSENAGAEELELSKALIQQLELQLEESRKVQQLQRDELRECKDRLKKRDVEHKAFLVQYETEKKAWKDESNEKQSQYQQEIQSRDDDLKDTRQKLQEQMDINQDLREKHQDDSKHLTYIKELEEEKSRLKIDYTRKKDLEKTQDEIKSQMKIAIEEQTKKTREFQSRIREIEGKHAEELEYWKGEVEDHRRQIELNSTRMENQLEEANARFADLERKHDKEVKEWQLLLDADITRAIGDGSHYEDAESQENMMAIGAGSTDAEALSPIRKEKNKSDDNFPNGDSKNIPNESMTMIDDLLHELGQMDVERTAILKEMENNEEPPEKSQTDMDKTTADVSVNSTESEVLDETLHLLNNLKTMLTSQENVNEHETTVIERLEVLSELMQSQEQSRFENTPAKPRILNSSSSAVDETPAAISTLQGNAKNYSFVSAMEDSVVTSPWAALVAELRSRCEFLERDRDEVTRITEQILEMERSSHKAELEAAIAEVERKHNEKLHMLQSEANQEMNDFYRNVLFQCEEEAFDYSDGREEIKLN